MAIPSCSVSPTGAGRTTITVGGTEHLEDGGVFEWYKCSAEAHDGWRFKQWEWDEVNRWTDRETGESGEETYHQESTQNPIDAEDGAPYYWDNKSSRYLSKDVTSVENLRAVFVRAEWVNGTGCLIHASDGQLIHAEDGQLVYDNGHWV